MTRTVLLDSEAVQALLNAHHRKHRQALAVIEATAARNRRRAGSLRLVVPTTVRVEAGWDRHAPGAPIKRLRVHDHALDGRAADRAASIRATLGVSIADAHLAVVLATTDTPHTVVTSDAKDLSLIADHVVSSATIVVL